ncbi:MAG: methyltransferase domain-containing protein [Alphaproteobacteria bacterium]
MNELPEVCQAPANAMLAPPVMDKSPSHVGNTGSSSGDDPLLVIRNLENRIDQLERYVALLDGRIGAAATYAQVDALAAAQSKNITEVLNALNMNMIAYVDDLFASAAKRDEMQNLLVESRDSLTTLIEASTVNLREMLNAMNADLLAYLEQRVTGAIHEQIDALLASQTKNIMEMVEASTASLRGMLNTMNSDLLAYTERRLAELAEEQYKLLMQSRQAAAAANGWVRGEARDGAGHARPKRSDHAPALHDVFASLARRAPSAWPLFERALDIGTRSYEGFPVGSCSVEGHREAERFGAFIAPYLRGYVLDVGCGPQPIPSYLSDYPVEAIRGIDPISTADEHPFEFVSAVAEDIPWEEASFDVVCSGTTLDHFFLLDVALREIRRVLKPGGHFVAWISEAPGSAPYDPYRDHLTPADEEHLFHIDRTWFLPLMHDLQFEEVEVLSFSVPFKHLFMSFRKPGA